MDPGVIALLVIFGLLLILILFGAFKFWQLTKALPIPKLDVTEYWGRGEKAAHKEDASIHSFTITYDDETINRLKNKLNEPITLHPPLEGIQHEYGINSKVLLDFVEYWRSDYMPRWSERETLINSWPHFKTQIQG